MTDKKKVARMILAINPGSTSTKLALFDNGQPLVIEDFEHSYESLAHFGSIINQFPHRLDIIERFLETHAIKEPMLKAVMGRGGLLHPLQGGVYHVTEAMLTDLKEARYGEHACNLGALLADAVARRCNCPAYIADPVVVDEMIEEARFSGMPEIQRKSIFHALNQKFAAREVALRIGRRYEELRMIVAHLGGGISVGSHRYGKVIDVNNALDGEGPFTPERSGGLPAGDLLRLAYSGTFTREQLAKKILGNGGLYAYWGSRDMRKLEKAVEDGDSNALLYLKAMVYQIAKEIASHGAVLEGKVDAVVLTGGLAKYGFMMELIEQRISYLAPVFIIPGEREMLSLAENAFAVLNGEREVYEYVGE